MFQINRFSLTRFRKLGSTIALHVALFAAGCGGSYLDSDAGSLPPSGLTIHVIAIRQAPDGVDVDLEIRNESTEPFDYQGYSPLQPLFRYQSLIGNGWLTSDGFFCGTGLLPMRLSPGERLTATARVHHPNRLKRLRVGISSGDGRRFTVWSSVIDPVLLRAGPSRSEPQ